MSRVRNSSTSLGKNSCLINYIELLTVASCENSMFLKPINSEECRRINNLSVSVVKITPVAISPAHVFKLNFENGTFPHQIKMTIVFPLFKKSNEMDMNPYLYCHSSLGL